MAALAAPSVAAISCFCAAAFSEESDRQAWRNFGIGSALYFIGNFSYGYLVLAEISAPFPSVAEASFFVMAVFFTVGMIQYGAVRNLVSRIQIYNFGLVFAAVALSASFLLQSSVASSQLSLFGTVFAFTYPVLWFSVGGFGLVCLLLYASPEKRIPFFLLVTAIILEASADFLYARALMNGTYQVGGIISWLWASSTVLIIWAAFEQMALGHIGARSNGIAPDLSERRLTEAMVPSVAVAVAPVSAALGAQVAGFKIPFLAFAVPVAFVFAGVVGMRERYALSVERYLRDRATASQEQLASSRDRLASVLESTTDSVIVLDRQWRIVFFNNQAAKAIGNAHELRLGGSLDETAIGMLRTQFEYSLSSATPVDLEHQLLGGEWLEIHAFPSPDGLSIFFRDISEARRIREEITYLRSS